MTNRKTNPSKNREKNKIPKTIAEIILGFNIGNLIFFFWKGISLYHPILSLMLIIGLITILLTIHYDQ